MKFSDSRRQFIAKHLPKAVGTTIGGLAISVGVLKYQAADAVKDIDDHEKRIRELEAYNNANVAKIQILLSKTHLL